MLLFHSEVAPLVRAVGDESPEVRIAALKAMVSLRVEPDAWAEAVPRIRAGLAHEAQLDPEFVEAAAFVPSRVIRARVQRLTQARDPAVRLAAADGLARAGDRAGVDTLVAHLEYDDTEVREAAAERLARIAPAPARGALRRAAARTEPSGDVRLWSALALARLGNTKPLEVVFRDIDTRPEDFPLLADEPAAWTRRLLPDEPLPEPTLTLLRRVAAGDGFAARVAEVILVKVDATTAVPIEMSVGEVTPELANAAAKLAKRYSDQPLPEAAELPQELVYLNPAEASKLVTTQFRRLAREPDPATAATVGGAVVTLAIHLAEPLEFDVPALFGVYRRAKPLRDHIARTLAFAGPRQLTFGLRRNLQAESPSERVDAARLLARAARYAGAEDVGAAGGAAPPPLPPPEPPREFVEDWPAAKAAHQAAEGARISVTRRTPHLDLSVREPLRPGRRFTITVYADKAPAVKDDELVISAPTELRKLPVEVCLVASEHFRLLGERLALIEIDRDVDRSTKVSFQLEVVEEVHDPKSAEITALFSYDGRACGSVKRPVRLIGQGRAPSRDGPPKPPSATIEVREGERPADLAVTVRQLDKNGKQFHCLVKSKAGLSAEGPWRPQQALAAEVERCMDAFTEKNAPPGQRRQRLLNAGKQLFEIAPEPFTKVFWALLDARTPLRTISIVSNEPTYPWELLVPHGKGRSPRPPLGVEYVVGRWIHEENRSAPQTIELEQSYVIAPKYTPPLDHAQREATFVLSRFTGTAIEPATWDKLDEEFDGGAVGVIHFVGHGVEGSRGQKFELECEQTLQVLDISGWDSLEAACAKAPLVFMNACQTGRQQPALVGINSFATEFIKVGAGCVIAPIWDVEDKAAHDVAREFYARVKRSRTKPFAKILGDIRRPVYEKGGGPDTYAAYCFYGDPLASRGRTTGSSPRGASSRTRRRT